MFVVFVRAPSLRDDFLSWLLVRSDAHASGELLTLTLAVFPPASYWENFHSCAATALADCHEGATDLWEKLKKQSRNLDFRGSLFELCGGGNAAPSSAGGGGLALVLPTVLTWLAF